jgi:hypothetical protein
MQVPGARPPAYGYGYPPQQQLQQPQLQLQQPAGALGGPAAPIMNFNAANRKIVPDVSIGE